MNRIKRFIAFPWTGQAIENFRHPRSSWQEHATLAERFRCRSFDACSFANAFSWRDTPQGSEYWNGIMGSLFR